MLWFIDVWRYLSQKEEKNLNTSYVMVHRYDNKPRKRKITWFKYILCYGSSRYFDQDTNEWVFKYILCYGSSALQEFTRRHQSGYLNTSYVMVHHNRCCGTPAFAIRFKYILCYGSSRRGWYLPVFYHI